ncbi:MAG: PHP domain-containing protein [Nitrococcus mobilis]|nr:PHP domain-containing protein [Nitrococcus mobilis]
MNSPIDLHAHSTASDGVLPPADLVARAAERGVRVLALTDHDTTDGLPAARRSAQLKGVTLISGVEVSVTWAGRTLHIVGLGVDAENASLQRGLTKIRLARVQRAREMARLLERAGLDGAWDNVCTLVQGDVVGRAHYARLLVLRGLAADPSEAFRRYLSRGRPGYVQAQWAGLDEVVSWVHQAGGLAVLAHPLQYRYPRAFLRRMLTAFAAAGGDALEIVTGGGTAEQTSTAAAYARRLGLAGSLGSDFHTVHSPWNDIGNIRPLPQGVVPIWERGVLLPQAAPVASADELDAPS